MVNRPISALQSSGNQSKTEKNLAAHFLSRGPWWFLFAFYIVMGLGLIMGCTVPSQPALTPQGTFVTVKAGLAKDRAEDLIFLKGLLEAGEIRPVIDRCYPLEQTAEAHRYVETGHKKGNVVITVAQNGQA